MTTARASDVPVIRLLAKALCAVAVLGATACASDPGAFADRMDRALASGDADQVERLLSRDSRPLFRAIIATSKRADGPFALVPPRQPTRTLGVQRGEAGVLLTVQVESQVRDWVLVEEDGELRLDLMSTSARRPWGAQTD